MSAEQAVGGVIAGTGTVTMVLGPVAGFWRDNRDLLTDPSFLVVAGLLVVAVVFLLLRKSKRVEESE